jgi:ABC-type Zn2+ transport system substrate-binding protein/surface adhesin
MPHEHKHSPEHRHTHSHEHEHTHSHEHTHEHAHSHKHERDQSGGEPGLNAKELALLKYMLEHNDAHANELRGVGDRLARAGLEAASERVREAVRGFERGNDLLREAIELCETREKKGN